LLDYLGLERLPPLHRNVNHFDWEAFRLEHSFNSVAVRPKATTMALRNAACTRGASGGVGSSGLLETKNEAY
jgi:hypothetical protein